MTHLGTRKNKKNKKKGTIQIFKLVLPHWKWKVMNCLLLDMCETSKLYCLQVLWEVCALPVLTPPSTRFCCSGVPFAVRACGYGGSEGSKPALGTAAQPGARGQKR